MSPEVALSNEIFRLYALIAFGVLAFAGLAIGVMRFGFGKETVTITKTYHGWLIMAPLVFAVLFAGRIAVILGVALLAMASFKEFARATGLYKDWIMTSVVYVGIIAVAICNLIQHPRHETLGWYGLLMALPVYVVALLMIIPTLRNQAKGQLQVVALAILGFIYLGWMFGHLGFLANSPHAYGYLLYIFFAVELNDVAAFTSGKLFGRTKLRSEISPNKTWGGTIGALAFSIVLAFLLRFSFPHFDVGDVLLTGLIVGVGGQLGDLAISFIKRDLGIKDMGSTIPGHGGILDRCDSLIFVAPLFFHMVRWFHGIY